MSQAKEGKLAALGGAALLALATVIGGVATASAAPSHTSNVLYACPPFTGYCNGVGTGTCNVTGQPQGWICPSGTAEPVEFRLAS